MKSALKIMLAAAAIAFSMRLPTALAEDYIPQSVLRLPQPRYAHVRTDVEILQGRQYSLPIVADQWQTILQEKVQALQTILEKQKSCDRIYITDSGIECIDEYKVCLRQETRPTKLHCTHFGVSKEDGIVKHCNDETTCEEWSGPRDHTQFKVDYKEVYAVRAKEGFLWWLPQLFFRGANGTEQNVSLPSMESASQAARLLNDAQQITTVIADDKQHYPLKEHAEKAQARYEQQRERAEKKRELSTLKKNIQGCLTAENDPDAIQICLENILQEGQIPAIIPLPPNSPIYE